MMIQSCIFVHNTMMTATRRCDDENPMALNPKHESYFDDEGMAEDQGICPFVSIEVTNDVVGKVVKSFVFRFFPEGNGD